MLPPRKETKLLWYCAACPVWWLAERLPAPNSWRLIRLTEIENLADQLLKAPAWRVNGPSPAVCPECGRRMAKYPVPNEATTPLVAIKN